LSYYLCAQTNSDLDPLHTRKLMFCLFLINPTGKRRLGRPSWGWEINIKMDLKEIRVSMGN
jgi:hypothetical protein